MHVAQGVFCKTGKHWINRQIAERKKRDMGRIWLAQPHRDLKGGFSPWAWPRSVEEAAWQGTLALDGVGPHAHEESGPGGGSGQARPARASETGSDAVNGAGEALVSRERAGTGEAGA